MHEENDIDDVTPGVGSSISWNTRDSDYLCFTFILLLLNYIN